jgi:toxin-antitoxin system PIN domain toxin
VRFLIDTNILLHAANAASPSHRAARGFFEEHLRLRTPWSITWPILYEFLRVSTHTRVFPKALTARQAIEFCGALIARDEVAILAATNRHGAVLETVVSELGHPAGNLFHDIHTAVLMREHGIPEIVTADTDFLQFGFLKVSNPLH